MTLQDVYSANTIAELFSLSEKEVLRYCLRQGELCLSDAGDKVMIYIPSLDVFTSYSPDVHWPLLSELKSNDYRIELEGAILSINSTNRSPFSYLLTSDYLDGLQEHIDITATTHTLLSSRRKAPVFVGHEKVIKRLHEELDENTFIVPFDQLHGAFAGLARKVN